MNYDYLFHVFVKACKLSPSLVKITVSFSSSTQVIVIAVTKWQKSWEGKKRYPPTVVSKYHRHKHSAKIF